MPRHTTDHRAFLAALFLIGLAMPAWAGTVYVSPAGSDTNDGLTWATAKRTVQAGLGAATAGDQVWVAAGTYVENITLVDGVALYGGFAGSEDPATFDLADRNFAANETIVDANQAGSVVTAPVGATETTRIDGFTIRNGNGTTTTAGFIGGGGIYCSSSSPTIANNRITDNVAFSGGGIFCSQASPRITNNTITGNTSGIYCAYTSAIITNNTITGNHIQGVVFDGAAPMIANTIVAFNSVGVSGDINYWGTPILQCNCVYGNAMYNYSGIANPTGANGNISVNPKLADAAYGNVHIQPDSPCVNAGDNSYAYGDVDMDGQLRIHPVGGTVDIGADESDGTVWPEGPYAIVHVSPDGDDANDGSTWTLAKRTVQSAVDTAFASGGEVWVQAGTYYERITLPPYVYFYGGFAGTENTRDERDWVTSTTILDGQQSGSVVTVRAGFRVNRIDGFTIRNGSATSGGGIYCARSALTIANNTITGNRAGSGGGISSSFSMITNNTITANSASNHGGGISCAGSSQSIIANNRITENSSPYGGGIASQGPERIINNVIVGNGALYGGGIYSHSYSKIAHNTIAGNCGATGGGVYCDSGSATVANCIIAGNSSGIRKSGSATPVLRYNCVYGNTTYDYSGIADPTGTNGNISVDPKLAGAAYGNVHIQPDSPCVDAGDSAYVLSDTDMDGQSRIQPAGGTLDIGADESDGTVWPHGPYAVVRISPAGDDANDGSTWALAKRTVQAGIDTTAVLGGEVWVQAGTYDERIALLCFAHVYGGFAGTETARNERDWNTNATTLDGQQGGSVVTVSAGHQVNTIDGFIIRNGNAPDGAGIHCSSSSPTITNNTITGNGAASSGGGIYAYHSFPTIAKNTITGNIATGTGLFSGGGGIYCYNCSPRIVENTITGNSAGDTGSFSGGGGIYSKDGSPTITSNVVTTNTSTSEGGGISCYKGSPKITSNRITDNSASLQGGGIRCHDGSPTIATNIIARNTAPSGGGLYCSAGSMTITQNAIIGNTASDGGGVHCFDSAPTISNNTIAANSASANGGGIYSHIRDLTIANSIVAFNSSGICISAGRPTLRYNCVYGNTAYNYSGVTDPTGTNGNISADPLFVSLPDAGVDGQWGTADDDYGDLRLQFGSPAIDAGNNADVPADVADLDGDGDIIEPMPFDLAGLLRFVDDPAIVDTGAGTPPIVDMGAYEYQAGAGEVHLVGAVSRRTHEAAGPFDLNLPLAGPAAVECRAGGPTMIVLTFDGPAAGASVQASAGNVDGVTTDGAIATATLSNVTSGTCLTFSVSGIAGLTGDQDVQIAVLAADANGDAAVNIFDLIAIRNQLNQPVTNDNFTKDVNADGAINIFDLIAARNQLNQTVAACP